MTQNISPAVMAQRAEPHDSLDFFPTPPWATRALCEHVIDVCGCTVWEPVCGDGAMVRPLVEYAGADNVFGSDVYDYGANLAIRDFLWPDDRDLGVTDWIITNPPFRLAEQFIDRALAVAQIGCAMLVRTVFLESVGRYRSLFSRRPPSVVAQFVERVPMVKGRLDRKASSATSYCWIVWRMDRHFGEAKLVWIPPCRARLERDEDYP